MSTGAVTAVGQEKLRVQSVKHGYYGRQLAKVWSPEQLQAYENAPRGTDCSDEIALLRANIADIDSKLLAGKTSVQGMRGEVFLVDIKDRLLGKLRGFLKSQHEMHPEAEMGTGKMKLEISIKSTGVEVDVKNIDDGGAAIEVEPGAPIATEEATEEAHSLEELFEDP